MLVAIFQAILSKCLGVFAISRFSKGCMEHASVRVLKEITYRWSLLKSVQSCKIWELCNVTNAVNGKADAQPFMASY